MGAHQGGRMVFTAEYIRRYFGVPKAKGEDAIYTEEYVEHVRGASHVVLEKRLQELKREAPRCGGPSTGYSRAMRPATRTTSA